MARATRRWRKKKAKRKKTTKANNVNYSWDFSFFSFSSRSKVIPAMSLSSSPLYLSLSLSRSGCSHFVQKLLNEFLSAFYYTVCIMAQNGRRCALFSRLFLLFSFSFFSPSSADVSSICLAACNQSHLSALSLSPSHCCCHRMSFFVVAVFCSNFFVRKFACFCYIFFFRLKMVADAGSRRRHHHCRRRVAAAAAGAHTLLLW